jgi:ankyrin repeat protein
MNLDETYERILLGIDKEKREYAKRLFKCLGFSRRPLRVNELAEVLAMQFRTAIPNLNTRLRPGDADKAVLSACSTLVTTVKLDDDDESDDPDNCNSRVVQFSHYSVKEFLTSERLAKSERGDLSQYHISPVPSHTVLAQSCICTLLHSDLQIGDITDGFPLAKYAAQNWFHHAQLDGVASQIQYGMVHLFDPAKTHFAVWVSIHNIDHSGPPNPPEPSPLYYATLSGISDLVEFLIITRQQDPNKSHGGWGTPLHAAAVLGHTAIARILLKHNADVNARDKHNSTPLHEASGSGNLDVMRLLLEHRVDVNVLDHWGGSPLYRAFQYQKFDAMKLLVEGGADVNVRNKSNSTVLHEASASGNLDVMRFLLSLGADVNVLDRWGDSPLHKAFRYPDAMKLLVLEGGANVNVRNKLKSTLLHDTLRSGNHDAMRFLLSLGADVNALDHQGFTLLHEASRYQKFDAVKLLVNEGADVNALDKSNSTPLHEASGSGNLDIARFLLIHGADVNALDHLGGSPLHKAIRYYDAVELLVSRGADVNVRDESGSTPLHEASGSGNLDVIELLLSRGADIDVLDHQRDSPLHRGFQYQKFDAMELLVNKGADVNVRNKSNSTLLHEASASRNLDVAQLLLNHGAGINALDRWGDAPLHKSFISLTSDVVEPQHKDHVTATHDTYNWTQIRKASGNVDLVPTLSKKCADAMNAWDNERSTPSHDASQGEKYAIAQLLLAHGADANARGRRRKTPLQLASLEGSLDVSRLLIEHGAVEAQNDEA